MAGPRAKAQEVKGEAKEKTGWATGSERLRAEGLADQGEAGVKKPGRASRTPSKM
jgi:uncharacterized protein YjbJ (UPF0337 family)